MINWISALSQVSHQGEAYVLLTVLSTKGSSPRDVGTKMLVTKNKVFDTIGGGALEHQSIKLARKLLGEKKSQQVTQVFNLGKDLKQCCGGVVTVFFEAFKATDFNIVIFGAGHIGKALVKILEEIDCQVTWFDSRAEQFRDVVNSNVTTVILEKPELAVESCPKNSYFLVMTHDHGLDQTLCEAILARGDSRYCGLIGSSTKGLKFRQRLLKKGYTKQELEQLTCPVGLSELKSKIPMEIAVSISADILLLNEKLKVTNVIHDSTIVKIVEEKRRRKKG